jgi:hypothetical protein
MKPVAEVPEQDIGPGAPSAALTDHEHYDALSAASRRSAVRAQLERRLEELLKK